MWFYFSQLLIRLKAFYFHTDFLSMISFIKLFFYCLLFPVYMCKCFENMLPHSFILPKLKLIIWNTSLSISTQTTTNVYFYAEWFLHWLYMCNYLHVQSNPPPTWNNLNAFYWENCLMAFSAITETWYYISFSNWNLQESIRAPHITHFPFNFPPPVPTFTSIFWCIHETNLHYWGEGILLLTSKNFFLTIIVIILQISKW